MTHRWSAVRDDYQPARGHRVRHLGGRLLFDVRRRSRLWIRRTGADVSHHDPGSRQSGSGVCRPVQDCGVGERHVLEGSRYPHGAAAQRLLHWVPGRGPNVRNRRRCRRIVRPGAAGLADARLQRSDREYIHYVIYAIIKLMSNNIL